MRQIRTSLESEGLSVWTDEHIKPGASIWEREIENALTNTGCMIVILTPNIRDAKGLRDEISYANIHKVQIFPLLAKGEPKDSVPYTLSSTQWVDIRDDYPFGINQIIQTVCGYLNLESISQQRERIALEEAEQRRLAKIEAQAKKEAEEQERQRIEQEQAQRLAEAQKAARLQAEAEELERRRLANIEIQKQAAVDERVRLKALAEEQALAQKQADDQKAAQLLVEMEETERKRLASIEARQKTEVEEQQKLKEKDDRQKVEAERQHKTKEQIVVFKKAENGRTESVTIRRQQSSPILQNIIKTFRVIVVVLILSWGPLVVMQFLQNITTKSPSQNIAIGLPIVQLNSPSTSATYREDVDVNIQAIISNAGVDIDRVEIAVDKIINKTLKAPNPNGASSFSIAQSWHTAGLGQHIITVTAFRADNSHSVPTSVQITIIKAVPSPTSVVDNSSPTPTFSSALISLSIITTQGVNLRSGPSTSFEPPIGSLSAGQTAKLLAQNSDGTWYKISYFSGTAWVFASFVTVSGDISQLPIASS